MEPLSQVLLVAAITSAGLEADSFRTREAFHRGLRPVAGAWWPVLTPLGVESRHRLRSICDPHTEAYWAGVAEAWFQRNRDNASIPWLPGHLYPTYAGAPELKGAPFDVGPPPHWPRWRAAAALYVRDEIGRTRGTACIAPILAEFDAEARRYCTDHAPDKLGALLPVMTR